ncbi:MAG: hypothetical protein KAI24_11055, partial [Planctomycetes bacterium]|nr:hypothetical protein [Planctomycetota bacterium]
MMPTWVHSVDDEGISPDLALGFTFPMRGVNWTHIAVSSNGVVYLTDGTGAVGDPRFGLASTANLVGVLGDSPRICPFSSDLMASMVSPWDIRVDSSVPGEIKVTWVSVAHYSAGVPTTEDFSMSARLTSNGVVEFAYEGVDYGDPDANDFVAVSAGDGVAGPPSPSDLSTTADSGTHEVIYENGWGLGFDLDGLAISLVSNGNGGFASDRSCRIARHEPFGAGCYDLAREAFYQEFPDASVASATLSGNGILMSPTANGYDVSWNPGLAAALYVPPTPGATLLPVLQANQVTFTPSVGFPTPEGAVTDLTVFGNGIIAFGAAPVQHFGWGPFVPSMFWDPHGGVYFWHIYNEEEGGDVWAEEAGGVIYITFEDVESYPLGTVNPSTWQLQIDQATGAMAMLFVHIDGNNSAVFGAYPQSHLIGFTPPGISQDPGPIDLVADLPMTTMSDVHSLELSAT